MHILRAGLPYLDKISHLFNAYRMFYKKASDHAGAEQFIKERLIKSDSVIFLAVDDTKKELPGIGFAQLYPTLASLGMHKMLILNDLFVEPPYRSLGVGRALMKQSKEYAIASGALRLSLSTQTSNVIGQKLYESEGYVKETDFLHYSLALPQPTQHLNSPLKMKP
jgi:GNAT superfamily N-acetyltransferase